MHQSRAAIPLPLRGVIRRYFAAFRGDSFVCSRCGKPEEIPLTSPGGPNGTRTLLYSGISRSYTCRLAHLGPLHLSPALLHRWSVVGSDRGLATTKARGDYRLTTPTTLWQDCPTTTGTQSAQYRGRTRAMSEHEIIAADD